MAVGALDSYSSAQCLHRDRSPGCTGGRARVDCVKVPADFQILLSTGVGKFPPEYADRVKIRLDESNRLLIAKAEGAVDTL